MEEKILKILLRNYEKISVKGGIAKVIFDDKFEDIAKEIHELCREDLIIAFEHGKLEAYDNIDKCNKKFNQL